MFPIYKHIVRDMQFIRPYPSYIVE